MTRSAVSRIPVEIDGALVVDKPAGPTSHDIVARVRRLTGGARVGHTGTLDPFATGVLPLLLGRATRLARFLVSDRKAYRATVKLGASTTTDDLDGEITRRFDGPLPAPNEVRDALAAFRGRIEQRPPDFSAKKIGGQPAYAMARRQEAVTLAPVSVETFHLEAEFIGGDEVVLHLECSSGYYVRALARDLGEALGCGAHLVALRRIRSGAFGEGQAVTLSDLDARRPAEWPVVAPADLLAWLPAAHVSAAVVERVSHGGGVAPDGVIGWDSPAHAPAGIERLEASGRDGPSGGDEWRPVRLLGPGGRLVAVARQSLGDSASGFLQPFVVLV